MAYGPPSYQAAAYRQLWMIIAPYVQSYDLYSACLVCRQWHSIFAPLLWGNPASRFGSDSDTVYCKHSQFQYNRVQFPFNPCYVFKRFDSGGVNSTVEVKRFTHVTRL
jgi:hypothetical protein